MLKNKNKTLMIIGAGTAQAAGIDLAKKMGCRVIAIDGDPKAPGLKVADVGIVLDIKDINGAIEVARRYHLDGVFSIASEITLPTVAAVNRALGLSGLTPEQVELVTNKGLMRQRYFESAVPSTDFFIIENSSQIPSACKIIGFPAVLKPVDNAGSRGVHFVESEGHVSQIYETVHSLSRSGKVILERFMPGQEVSVEAFVLGGKVHILTLSDKDRTEPPFLLDTAVMFPSAYSQEIQERIKDVAVNAINAMGIDNCPIHMELMITTEGPKVVELAARGPGFRVYTDIIPYVTGVNGVEAQILLLLGKTPNLTPRMSLRGACIKFFAGKNGTIRSIRGIQEARSIGGVFDLDIYVSPGDSVRDLTSGADRIGHVIALSNTRQEACTAAENCFRAVHIDVIERGV